MMRPDDLHMAMRSDLVLILKDVVGLIARIEATLPPPEPIYPQPASFPAVQSEGAGKKGGDQRAQKSETPRNASEAGAAQAGLLGADPRNSSRSAGEVASAPLPVGRTNISDQPTDAALPPSAAPAEPPAAVAPQLQPAPQEAPQPTRTERVLDIWATTDLTAEQIASRTGCAVGSVMGFVYAARKKNDPRGFARKLPHDDKLSESPALKLERPALIKRADDEPPVAGFAKPVERKPFDKPKSSPYDPRPGRLAGVTITSPGTVVSLDMVNFVVACPGGDWQTSRPVALIMERMRNGETFDDQTLADLGSMGLSTFADSKRRWTEELAKRGVEFVHTKHVGCKIRVAGT